MQILGGFHKADGEVVATDGNRGFQVAEVFLGQRACGQTAAAFIDAFVAFQHMAVFNLSNNLTAFNGFHGQSQQTVVQPQNIARDDIIRQVAVVQTDCVTRAFAFECGIKNQRFAFVQFDAAAGDFADTDFRTLQVGEDGDFLSRAFCRFTHDAGVFLMEFRRAVAEVETDDIQTAYTDHVFQQLDIVAARPQRSDDFGVVADAGYIAFCITHVKRPFGQSVDKWHTALLENYKMTSQRRLKL